MAAEYDNYRKRTTREADQKFNDGVSYAVNQIIPILDTLEMAANAPCADENYKKGVTMTLEKAAKAFQTLRVEEIEVLGKPFDPNLMNAVQQVPVQEGAGERHRRHRLPERLQAGRQDRPPRHRGGGRIGRPGRPPCPERAPQMRAIPFTA